jgi:hypothetical protein
MHMDAAIPAVRILQERAKLQRHLCAIPRTEYQAITNVKVASPAG